MKLEVRLGRERIDLQVDVGFGFGDAITPKAEALYYSTFLCMNPPRLHTYPRETVVAEKLEALVKLGMANSRMKDFFDLAVLARSFPFTGLLLWYSSSASCPDIETQTGLTTRHTAPLIGVKQPVSHFLVGKRTLHMCRLALDPRSKFSSAMSAYRTHGRSLASEVGRSFEQPAQESSASRDSFSSSRDRQFLDLHIDKENSAALHRYMLD